MFRMSTVEHAELVKAVEEMDRRTRMVILPHGHRMQLWRCVMLMVQAYSFIVTPVQVAFIRTPPLALFIINRFVDAAFFVDLVLNFFLAYKLHPDSPVMVMDLKIIRKRYLCGWFVLDALSFLSSISELVSYADQAQPYTVQVLRIVRILCVFRLVKVGSLAASATGWQIVMRFLQNTLSSGHVSIYLEELVRWVLKLLLMAHFVACLWGCVAMMVTEVYDGQVTTWMTYLFDQNPQLRGRDSTLLLYLLSLYWSLMTLATIGYGDITPKCLAEYIVATFVMVVSATMWTILMAQACSVIALKDEKRMTESLEVEALVDMCQDYDLAPEMTQLIKKYFLQSRSMHRHYRHQEVLKLLSPAMQSQITAPVLEPYLKRVPFLESGMIEPGLLKVLSRALQPNVHSPSEWIVPQSLLPFVNETVLVPRGGGALSPKTGSKQANQVAKTTIGELDTEHQPPLTIMKAGVALHHAMLAKGSVWHEDCILTRWHLRDGRVAQAIGFCAVYTLSGTVLSKSLQRGDFPYAASQVRKRAVKLAFMRLVKRAATLEQKMPCGLKECIEMSVGGQDKMMDLFKDTVQMSRSSFDFDILPKALRGGHSSSPNAALVSTALSSIQASLDHMRQELQESKKEQLLLMQKIDQLSEKEAPKAPARAVASLFVPAVPGKEVTPSLSGTVTPLA